MSNEIIIWSPGVTLEQIEKEVILKAFRFYRGNKTTTSIALGIAVRTLDNKLAQYGEDTQTQEKRKKDNAAKGTEFLERQRNGHQYVEKRAEGATAYDSSRFLPTKPSPKISKEPSMSLQERQEIQNVLHENAPVNGNGKRSRKL